MKDFKILFSLLTVFLFLFSCQSTIDDSLIEPDIVDGVVFDRTDDTGDPDGGDCDCIIFVDWVSLNAPSFPYSYTLQTSTTGGNPFCSNNCPTVSLAGTNSRCISPNTCATEITYQGFYDFNCSVPNGGGFNLNLNAIAFEIPCTSGSIYEELTMHYQICCGTSSNSSSSGGCQQMSCSDFYVIESVIANSGNHSFVLEDIEGCDCIPVKQ